MFPLFPILFVAMRAGRGRSRVTVVGDRAIALVMWLFLFPVFIAMLPFFWANDIFGFKLIFATMVSALVAAAFPWPIARFVLVPRGFVKAAYWFTRASFWVWGGDREGGAVVAGVFAIARGKLDDGARKSALAWLDARVNEAKLGHGGLLLAQSLLARLRGDHERADQLLAGIVFLPDEIVPVPARALAAEVVLSDAFARGEFARAANIASTKSSSLPLSSSSSPASGSVAAQLLGACAQALGTWPPPPPSRFGAWWWRVQRALLRMRISRLSLLVRPRAAWRRLVDDARAALSSTHAPATAPAARNDRDVDERTNENENESSRANADARAPGGDVHVGAQLDGASGASVAPLDVDGLSPMQAAVLWSAHARRVGSALDDDERVELGSVVDSAAFALTHEISTDVGLVDEATDALVEIMRGVASSWSVAQRSASSTLGRIDADSRALDELVDRCERLPRPEPLPAAAELEEWARIRLLYDRALADAGDERAMGPWMTVRDALWNHSARIFNKGQKGIGRAIFHFLLGEAQKRNDEPAVKGMKKNLRAQ